MVRQTAPTSGGEQERERRLVERVRKALWRHEPLRASGSIVELEADGGLLRLGGRVRTLALKHIAARLAASVEGVEQVENRLISDPEVVRGVAGALAEDQLTRPHVIRVEARLGQARLAGLVPSPEVEQRALELARSHPLVVGVASDLEIDPTLEMASEGAGSRQPAAEEATKTTTAD